VADRLVRADSVRSALAFVDRGEALLGIVYETDALVDKHVRVVDVFPANSHLPIIYPIALTSAAKPNAARFVAYIRGPAAMSRSKPMASRPCTREDRPSLRRRREAYPSCCSAPIGKSRWPMPGMPRRMSVEKLTLPLDPLARSEMRPSAPQLLDGIALIETADAVHVLGKITGKIKR